MRIHKTDIALWVYELDKQILQHEFKSYVKKLLVTI